MEFLNGLLGQPWYLIAVEAVGLFAAIAAITPNKSDDKIVQFLLDVINFIGVNFGKAKNKE